MEVSTYLSQLAQQIDAAMPTPTPAPSGPPAGSSTGVTTAASPVPLLDGAPSSEWDLDVPWATEQDGAVAGVDREGVGSLMFAPDTPIVPSAQSTPAAVTPTSPEPISAADPAMASDVAPAASPVPAPTSSGPSWAGFSEQRTALVAVTDEIAELLATARGNATRITSDAEAEAAAMLAAATEQAESTTRAAEQLLHDAEQRRDLQSRQMADEMSRHRAELDRIEIEGSTRAAALRQAAEREAANLVAEARRQAFQLLAADDEVRRRVESWRAALDQLLVRHASMTADLGGGRVEAPVVDLREAPVHAGGRRFEPAEGLVTRITGS